MSHIKNAIEGNDGFTLIETIIVIVVLSITTMAVIPRLTTYFSNKRENFAIATGYITKTFDDAFLNNRTNFLTIHLYEPGSAIEENEEKAALFSQNNGFSVLNAEGGKFVLNDRKVLKPREFPESFRIEKVLIADGREYGSGSVLIPFYPQGYSSDIMIHVTVNDEEMWTIVIKKYMKEPDVQKGHQTFSEI